MDHHIFCRLPREVSDLFLLPACAIAHYFRRVLLATIRDQGLCPCPRCLVPKQKLDQLGSFADTRIRVCKACKYDGESICEARRLIYEHGLAINSAAVQRKLMATSSVPTLVSF